MEARNRTVVALGPLHTRTRRPHLPPHHPIARPQRPAASPSRPAQHKPPHGLPVADRPETPPSCRPATHPQAPFPSSNRTLPPQPRVIKHFIQLSTIHYPLLFTCPSSAGPASQQKPVAPPPRPRSPASPSPPGTPPRWQMPEMEGQDFVARSASSPAAPAARTPTFRQPIGQPRNPTPRPARPRLPSHTPVRLPRRDLAPCQQQPHRHFVGNLPDQPVNAPAHRCQPHLRLREAEPRMLGRNDDVARQRNLQPAAQRGRR